MRHPALLSLMFAALSSAGAHAQTELFFTEYQFQNPKIKSIGLDGSGLQELFTIPAQDWLPVGLTVDPAAGKLYWSDSVSPNTSVFVAGLDGSGLQELISTTGGTRGPALDGLGKLYYSAGSSLRRANLDGSADQLLFTANQSFPLRAPYADGVNGHVYFAADHSILRMNLDGSDVKTLVRGISTPGPVALDVGGGFVYWLDSNTNSDYIGRARLDGSDFRVLIDNSPGIVQSSGLISLLLDRSAQELYVADDLRDDIRRFDADGTNGAPFYTSPAGLSPSGLTLDSGEAAQAMLDCNANGIFDGDDIALGTSSDCNDNGLPDECEAGDPCATPGYLLDQGSNPSTSGRALGGPSPTPGAQWEVFQPFDVPAAGWSLAGVEFDGFTVNYANGAGFTATLLPDDGSGSFADEGAPIASTALNFRFDTDNSVWVGEALAADLAAGRYWLRLTSADQPTYQATVNVGTSGLGSVSRSGLGNLFPAPPIALRLVESGCEAPVSYCLSGLNSTGLASLISASGSASVSQADLVLHASKLPSSQNGIFYFGPNQIQIAFGNGWRCVGGSVTRLPVLSTGSGSASFALDAAAFGIGAGDSLNFQFWYRDPLGGGAFFNLTDGLAATFCR